MKGWFLRQLMLFVAWLEWKNLPNKWLFRIVYPDYDKPLTKEESDYLIEVFKPWRIEEDEQGKA